MNFTWNHVLAFAAATVLWAVWVHTTEEPVQELGHTYDYIIVGAGTSGSVLAAKLSTANPVNKVLLIEAGGEPPWYSWIPLIAPVLQGGSYDWSYRTVPQQESARGLLNNESFWPQGRMLGGSGQMNFLIHSTGHSSDFDGWHVPGWDSKTMKAVFDRLVCWVEDPPTPKRRSLLLGEEPEMCFPSATASESASCGNENDAIHQCPSAAIKLQRVNPQRVALAAAFLDAAKLCGYQVGDLNRWQEGENATGTFMASHNTIDEHGRRWSPYGSYLKLGIRKKWNLHIFPRSQVTRINFQKNQAVGVDYTDAHGRIRHVGVRKEILLSAGAIKTPQILQLSGIGPSPLLKSLDIPVVADLPVGENLQDHLQVPLYVELNASVSLNVMKFLQPTQMWNYLVHGTGIFATSGIEGIAKINLGGSSKSQGMLILFNMGYINSEIYSSVANIKKEVFHRLFPRSDIYGQEGFVLISVCLHPRSRGKIRILSADPRQHPAIDPAYFSHPYDVECMIDTISQGVELLNTQPFQALGARLHWPTFPECGSPGTRRYMECLVRTAALTMYHPVGTSAMGDGDRRSVVDAHLRVRGVGGLRVMDASVIPNLPSGPPSSILVAMAEKAADMVLEQNSKV